MLHYHGTPITPRSELEKMKGKHFCVSFSDPRDSDWCIKNAQSIMWDNGAFSSFTRGAKFDKEGFIAWVDDKLYGAHWAVIPDLIGGGVQDQKDYMSGWPYPKHLSAPVWHMHLPIDWLVELTDNYPRVCFGSSGQYWKVNSPEWQKRADLAWESIEKTGNRPWVHMMRGLKLSDKRWPFASADSTNVARNFKNKDYPKCPKEMAEGIDAKQPPLRFKHTQSKRNMHNEYE